MNLLQLKATVAAYHQVGMEDLTSGPVDLFLVAANNARKSAEKLHDFEYCRCTAVLDIDGVSGGRLVDAVITPADVFSGIHKIVAISGLRNGTDFVPLDYTRADISIERDRYELELSDAFWPTSRYPSDAQIENVMGNSSLVLRAGTIYNFPRSISPSAEPLTTYLEAYGWLLDYTADMLEDENAVPQDYFVDVGFEYLQWTIIIELNHVFHTFVPRQEGNVGSPEQKRQEAWRNLLLDDSYLVDPQATRSR